MEIPSQNGHPIKCIAFKPDGYDLVGGDDSGNIRQWKVDNGEINSSVMNAKTDVYAVAVSTDGRWIVSGDLGNKVIIWDAATHTLVRQISEHTSCIYGVDISNDSTRVISASGDRTVRIFNIRSGVRDIPPLTHEVAVLAAKFSPDGNRIATVTHARHTSVYDAHFGNKLFDISIQINWAPIIPFTWSSNGEQLFVASSGKITCFEASTSFRSEWVIHENTSSNVSIVSHGQFIACAAGSAVSFWDYTSRQQIGNLVGHAQQVNCISISHDGRYLACGHDKGITVYNLGDFLPLEYLNVPRVSRFPLMQVSDAVLESWTLGNTTDAESTLSDEIGELSDPNHYVYAARSLIRARLREWKTALEDADMSLQIKRSPIGHIARSLALVGAGNQEVGLDDFDFVFCDCDSSDNMLLLVVKSILMFVCGKRKQAVSRLQYLITAADEKTKASYMQVLVKMYLKRGDYENAVQTLELAKKASTSENSDSLTTISLIFKWNFDRLEVIAWQRLCESLYASGRINEVGEKLLKLIDPLDEDEKESVHGHILEEIVMRSGQVTLLAWTGKSSKYNSCLPSSPAVYGQQPPFTAPRLEPAELEKRTDELRAIFPFADAHAIYVRATNLQPVRFTHFRLLLPCIVFGVRSLRKGPSENVYHAEVTGLGNVEFTTADTLPLKEPRKLVFADLRIHGLLELHATGSAAWEDDRIESDAESNASDMVWNGAADAGGEPVHVPIIEEVPAPEPELDTYTRALQLIAHLGQPFSALLLLRQSDGAYRRIAADREIVVGGVGKKVPKDIRVEVLEIL